MHLLPPGIRQRVAQGLPARGATQLALYPLADLRLLETGESEGDAVQKVKAPSPRRSMLSRLYDADEVIMSAGAAKALPKADRGCTSSRKVPRVFQGR